MSLFVFSFLLKMSIYFVVENVNISSECYEGLFSTEM